MAAITGAVIGAGTAAYSISKSIKEGQEKKAAARAIENSKAPELQNVADGLQVSTEGSDLQREEQARNSSNQVQAAQEAGTRGVIGSVGKIAAQNQKVAAETGANLDAQKKEIEQLKAQDKLSQRGINEDRFRGKLSALSSQYNSAAQNQQQAMGNAIQGTGMLVGSLSKIPTKKSTPDVVDDETGDFNF